MYSCGEKFVKFLMIIFNIVFVLCGIGLIVVGGIAQSQYDQWYKLIHDGQITGPAVVIAVGVFLALVSFFGCCGALKESPCLLYTYSAIVGLICIVQLGGGIAAFIQKDKLEDIIEPDLRRIIKEYYNTTSTPDEIRKVIDTIQTDFSCCGSDNFTDYFDITPAGQDGFVVPVSCCIEREVNGTTVACNRNQTLLIDHCGTGRNDTSCPIFDKGCHNDMQHWLVWAIEIAGGTAIGLSFLEMIGVVFACFLARRIKKNGYI